MHAVQLDRVADLRARYWDNGYRPIAVLTADKRPLNDRWTETARQDPPEAIRYAPVPHAGNTGILCDGLRAVDVDIDDAALAGRVRALAVEMLGEAPLRVRGNSARFLLLYRAAEGQPRKVVLAGRLGKVEVLGHGQQFVADGEHPSHADYGWAGDSPADVPCRALPAVDEERLRAFLDAAAGVIEAERLPDGGADVVHLAGKQRADSILRVASWLHVIPNVGPPDWEYWNMVGMACFGATGGTGYALWADWGSRHPAFSTVEALKRWENYRKSPPRELGAGRLWYLAEQGRGTGPGATPLPGNDDEHPSPLGEWDAGEVDYDALPPRRWLLGTTFCRGFLSGLISTGAGGKTTLRLLQLLSLATGRNLTGEHVFARTAVLMLILEDGRDEAMRRIRAAMLHHRIGKDELAGWFFVSTLEGITAKLLTLVAGDVKPGDLLAHIDEIITRRNIGAVCIDPLKKAHGVDENSNSQMDVLATMLTEVAIRRDVAMDAPYHANKMLAGDPGNVHQGRGASAYADSGRLIYTISPMSADDAKKMGVEDKERRFLRRVDDAKVNIAPPDEARWFRLVNVPLHNGDPTYPNGDHVQTIEPWTPPDLWEGITPDLAATIIRNIDAGTEDGRPYSNHPNAQSRAAAAVCIHHVPNLSEQQARSIIDTWIRNGALIVEPMHDPKQRKMVDGLKAGHNLPGNKWC